MIDDDGAGTYSRLVLLSSAAAALWTFCAERSKSNPIALKTFFKASLSNPPGVTLLSFNNLELGSATSYLEGDLDWFGLGR